MGHGMHSLLGGLAAVALGLTAFAGRFEPGQNSRQVPPRNAADGVRLPERPRTRVDTAPVSPTGRTIRVPAGGDLQAAINDAKAGDAIALEPGATYTGPFRLPRKDGDGWIVIAPQTERGLPPPGQRVTPSNARAMSDTITPMASRRGIRSDSTSRPLPAVPRRPSRTRCSRRR